MSTDKPRTEVVVPRLSLEERALLIEREAVAKLSIHKSAAQIMEVLRPGMPYWTDLSLERDVKVEGAHNRYAAGPNVWLNIFFNSDLSQSPKVEERALRDKVVLDRDNNINSDQTVTAYAGSYYSTRLVLFPDGWDPESGVIRSLKTAISFYLDPTLVGSGRFIESPHEADQRLVKYTEILAAGLGEAATRLVKAITA